jgi:ribosomal protein S18 acetylase RimI-like enzyme
VGQISESDIGKRVTIRLHDAPGFRDIVGHLLSPTSLKNRHGEIVQFDPAQIYIWREISDVPRTATSGAPLSIRIYDLERSANKTWPAKEELIVGNWIFRADVGVTRRANSALILGSDDHIDQMIAWYQERGLNPTVSLVPGINQELDAVLENRGFEKLLDLEVLVKDPVETKVDFHYEISDKPSHEWLAIHGDEPIKDLLSKSRAKHLTMKERDMVIAIGRIAFADDWAVLSRIWVTEEERGKGYGRKMLHALEAESAGAKLALQVRMENSEAYELYKSAGYVNHHSCRFRALPR